MARRILVVDDDPAIRELIREFLADGQTEVAEAETGGQTIARLAAEPPDLVLLDMLLPDMDGLEVLAQIRSAAPIPVVVITADSSGSRTIRAMQAGAYDYLVKPLEPEHVRQVVDRALEHLRLSDEVRALQDALATRDVRERLVGSSPAMQEVYKLIGRVAASGAPVLIAGETGTGKELVAETIHLSSPRARGPLVRVNCAALPETLLESELFGHEKGAFTGAIARRKGRFELADGGTIFLDEIGDLNASTQKKLLRVLQFGEFERVGGSATIKTDVRVVTATNKQLELEVAAGRFREDLYYRLNVIRIDMPPLRERREDIIPLVAHFLDKYRRAPGSPPTKISQEAMDLLLAYDWPGNVRQLENTIMRAVVMASEGVIGPEHLDWTAPPASPREFDVAELARRGVSLQRALAEVERDLIAEVLRQTGGDHAETARRLGIYRGVLEEKLREYGIGRPQRA